MNEPTELKLLERLSVWEGRQRGETKTMKKISNIRQNSKVKGKF